MALNNCTINSQSFTKTSGNAIGSDNAQLVITPNQGYVVSAANFTNNTGPLTGVLSITLSDSGTPNTIGNTVIVDIDLDDSYVMPASDTNIVIDIDGNATLEQYTISGSYDTVESNTTTTSGTGFSYSSTGDAGQQVTLFTKTFTAANGYYFENLPSYTLSAASPSKYTITNSTTTDSSNRVTSITFTVKYTFSATSEAGDYLLFTASATQIITPTVGVFSYTMNTSDLDTAGESRVITIYGSSGYQFQLYVRDSNGNYVSGQAFQSETIPSTGIYFKTLTFPSVTSNQTYEIEITGDTGVTDNFDGPSQQPSSFNILQVFDVTVSINLSTVDPYLSISSGISKSLSPNSSIGAPDSDFSHTFTLSTPSANTLTVPNSTIPSSAFSNIDSNANGGTTISITSATVSSITDDGTNKSVTVTLVASVTATGNANVSSIGNIDSYIVITNHQPITSNLTQSTSAGGVSGVVLSNLTSDYDGDSLTYKILSLPSGGTLYTNVERTNAISTVPYTLSSISGTLFYEDDINYPGNTSFTYTANDGTTDGTTSTVTINIT